MWCFSFDWKVTGHWSRWLRGSSLVRELVQSWHGHEEVGTVGTSSRVCVGWASDSLVGVSNEWIQRKIPTYWSAGPASAACAATYLPWFLSLDLQAMQVAAFNDNLYIFLYKFSSTQNPIDVEVKSRKVFLHRILQWGGPRSLWHLFVFSSRNEAVVGGLWALL